MKEDSIRKNPKKGNIEREYSSKEQYLKALLEQVRCKKAHTYIREEIECHMEEQIEDNLLSGMTQEEAERTAVEDMGSPIETGIALDHIHRPKMAWSMVLFMAVVALLGIAIHQGIVGKLLVNTEFATNQTAIINGSSNFVWYTLIGFGLMLLIYRMDYITIGKHAKVLAVTFLAALLFTMLFGQYVNGRVMWLVGFGSVNVSIYSFVMLYVPLYGAVLYKYFGTGYKGLGMAILWGIAPVCVILGMRYTFLAGMMAVILTMVLSMAIWLNWFRVSRKKVLVALWGVVAGIPVLGITLVYKMGWLAPYQMHRIQAFLTNSGDANYVTGMLRSFLANSNILGDSGLEVVGWLSDFNSSWILMYLASAYGIAIMVLAVGAVVTLIIKIFAAVLVQKNQLGMIMGFGCGSVFLVQTVLNLLENVGFFPATRTFLPFLSAGGSDLIISYMLMGIVLSVYRYKSIYPKHVSVKGKEVNIRISF